MSCKGCGSKVTYIMHGVTGLTKAALGIDQASDETIAVRRDKCRVCPHASRNPLRINRKSRGLTSMSMCDLCNCFIAPKTTLNKEACPDKRWLAVTE